MPERRTAAQRKQFRDKEGQAIAAAQIVAQRRTCEGCAYLRGVRPMCQAEHGPHYRQPRHQGNDRCAVFAPQGSGASA